LAARAGGTREPPRQLGLRDGDPCVDSKSGTVGGRHESIIPLVAVSDKRSLRVRARKRVHD
jgi:hypothetical protein